MKILHVAFMKEASSGIVNQMSWEQEAAIKLGILWKSILFVQKPNGLQDSKIVEVWHKQEGSNLLTWFELRKAYYRWLEKKAVDFDVILLRHSLCDPYEYFFIKKIKKPVYLIHHTLEIEELLSYNNGIKSKIKSLIETSFGRKAINCSNGVIAVTKEIFYYENSRVNGKFKKEIIYPNGIFGEHNSIVDERRGEVPEIVFIASYFHAWHGLDLLLNDMNKSKSNFILHIIGEVSIKDKYILEQDSRVILHGHLNNAEINQLMAKMWIGLASFGLFRKGMKEACTLKVREYLNYGLPVYSGHVDIFPSDFKYYKIGEPKFEDILNYAKEMKIESKQNVISSAKTYIDKECLLRALYNIIRE